MKDESLSHFPVVTAWLLGHGSCACCGGFWSYFLVLDLILSYANNSPIIYNIETPMKYLTQTILYGARLLQNTGDVSSKGLVSLMSRKLQNTSVLMDSRGTEVIDKFEKCDVDVDDLYSKAIGAMMSNGSALLDESASVHDKLEAEAAVIESLKDDDEMECNAEEENKFTIAQKNLLKCLDIDTFLDSNKLFANELPLMEEIKDECASSDELFALEAANLLDEDGAVGESTQRCAQKILGHNEVGNFIRHIYDNLPASAKCLVTFSEELPHCYITIPMEVEDDSEEFKLPLSLEKKLDCLIGGFLEDSSTEFCTSTFEALGECLPKVGANFIDDEIASSCAEEGALVGKTDFLGMDSSVLTQNKILPDFCVKVLDQNSTMKEVEARLQYYNENRDYGWTVEKKDPEVSTQVFSSGFVSSRVEANSNQVTSGSHTAFLPLALVVAGLVVVVCALFFTRRSVNPSPPPSAFQYPEFDHNHEIA